MNTSRSTAGRTRTPPVACRACDLNEICRLTGLIAFEGGRSRQSTGALRTVRSGATLFRAGAPAHALYAVRQGMIKTTRMTADGDERVVAFHAPGEVLGLEAFSMGTYACDASALEPSICCEVPLPLLGEVNSHVRELSMAVVRLLSQAAAPRTDLARGSARQRVTNFLVDLAERLTKRGLDAQQLMLSMSRQEIASLLDTRIETVSRTLQQLNREKAIHVRGTRVKLLNLGTITEEAAASVEPASTGPSTGQ
jgi:CRP/FNR family transcriptional regulator